MAFLGFSYMRSFPTEPAVSERAAGNGPAEQDETVGRALQDHETAMQDLAGYTDEARIQHDRAMKAVEAARALAKSPDSPEARAAFDKAVEEVSAGARKVPTPDRSDWKAEDYSRALREGRSLTQ